MAAKKVWAPGNTNDQVDDFKVACYMTTSTTGYDTDLGCISSTQAHLAEPSMLELLYLSDDNNLSCIKAQEQRSRCIARSIVTINLYHDVKCDWAQKAPKQTQKQDQETAQVIRA